MSEEYQVAAAPAFKDRSTRLVAFGVVQLCLGAVSGLMVALLLFSAVVVRLTGVDAAQAGPSTGFIIFSTLIYGLIAAWFIGMGIGSILARRWARALTLVAAWIGLIAGTLGMLFMAVFMRDIMNAVGQQEGMPPGFATTMTVTMVGVGLVIYIMIPGVLVLFYSGKSVRLTCEYKNPEPSWTDACPLPVLAHAFMFVAAGISMIFMAGYNWATPVFGTILSGAAGAAVLLPVMVVLMALGWGAYKLKPAAWWGSIIFVPLWMLVWGYSLTQVDLMDYYRAMGMPEQQLESMRPMIESGSFDTMMASFPCWGIVLFAFLIYTKRYYPKTGGGPGPG